MFLKMSGPSILNESKSDTFSLTLNDLVFFLLLGNKTSPRKPKAHWPCVMRQCFTDKRKKKSVNNISCWRKTGRIRESMQRGGEDVYSLVCLFVLYKIKFENTSASQVFCRLSAFHLFCWHYDTGAIASVCRWINWKYK